MAGNPEEQRIHEKYVGYVCRMSAIEAGKLLKGLRKVREMGSSSIPDSAPATGLESSRHRGGPRWGSPFRGDPALSGLPCLAQGSDRPACTDSLRDIPRAMKLETLAHLPSSSSGQSLRSHEQSSSAISASRARRPHSQIVATRQPPS